MILPQSAMAAVDPVAQALAPAEAFTWGHGGLKMTPQQAVMLREQGMARSRGDYSPVQHWTQGLARVADNVMGALDARRAEKQLAAGAETDRALMEAMVGGQVDDSMIARALMDPNVGQGVKEFAGMEYAARRPKAAAPTNIEKLMMARGIQPGTPEWNAGLDSAILNETDPFVTFQGPTYGYTGRQSGLAAAMGGGGPVSGAAQGASPPAEAVAALQRGEGTPEQFDEMFGQGAAARALGGSASAPDPFRR